MSQPQPRLSPALAWLASGPALCVTLASPWHQPLYPQPQDHTLPHTRISGPGLRINSTDLVTFEGKTPVTNLLRVTTPASATNHRGKELKIFILSGLDKIIFVLWRLCIKFAMGSIYFSFSLHSWKLLVKFAKINWQVVQLSILVSFKNDLRLFLISPYPRDPKFIRGKYTLLFTISGISGISNKSSNTLVHDDFSC